MGGEHVDDLLAGLASGTLAPDDARRVAVHLPRCAACRAREAQWRAIALGAVRFADAAGEPSPDVFARVEARLATDPAPGTAPGPVPAARVPEALPVPAVAPATAAAVSWPRLAWLWQLVVGQVPLVRRGLWLAAPVVLAAGTGMALTALLSGQAGAQADAAALLALCAPALAAVGVALVYGPDNDPGLELALATRTPPRLILLARLALVVGYDLVLALLANALVAAVAPDLSFPGLVQRWLAPMALLSAGSLLLSLVAGPLPAIGVALALWATQLLAFTPGREAGLAGALDDLWAGAGAGPWAWALAAALAAAALWVAPRRVSL